MGWDRVRGGDSKRKWIGGGRGERDDGVAGGMGGGWGGNLMVGEG